MTAASRSTWAWSSPFPRTTTSCATGLPPARIHPGYYAPNEGCPLDMQIQMRYLCERLADPIGGKTLGNLIEHLERNLIDAPRISLAPAECYALITPIIAERLRGIRHSIA